jgi:hypothetical protein
MRPVRYRCGSFLHANNLRHILNLAPPLKSTPFPLPMVNSKNGIVFSRQL